MSFIFRIRDGTLLSVLRGSFVTALLLLTFCSCTKPPETVYGTEGTYESPTRKQRVGVRPVQITARLVAENRSSVPGIAIRAAGASSADIDTTNSNGLAQFDLVLEEDDRVEFFFSSAGGETEWTETLREVPKGVAHFSVLFEQDHLGRIRIAAIEF